MPPVLELLVTLTHDSYTQVSENAHQALVRATCPSPSPPSLMLLTLLTQEMFSEQYATEGERGGSLFVVITFAILIPRLSPP